MLHHIIVKYNDKVRDKMSFNKEVEALFKRLESECKGVRRVFFHHNCIDRSNRYDLMIVIDLDKDELETYDSSEVHKTWKMNYSDYLEKKCIFDYED